MSPQGEGFWLKGVWNMLISIQSHQPSLSTQDGFVENEFLSIGDPS